MRNLSEEVEPGVGHGHDPDVWIDGAKGIVLRRRFVRSGNGIEKSGFPDVRQADNSSAEHLFL
jgi:hypothetical protein